MQLPIIQRLSIVLPGLLLFSCAFAQQPDSWRQIQSFGHGPLIYPDGVAFSSNGKGFIGLGSFGDYQKEMWEYDTLTNSWSQKETFPGLPFSSAAHFMIGDRLYVTTGYSSTGEKLKQVWAYNSIQNNWEQKKNFPGAARAGAFAFALNGKGYLGGDYGINLPIDFWEYDPLTDSWMRKNDLPVNGIFHAAFGIMQKAYITVDADFWEYDPMSDHWEKTSGFHESNNLFSFAFVANNKGYVGAGEEFWEFNPETKSWLRQPGYPGAPAMGGFLTFVAGNKGYVAGAELLSFDVATKSWKLETHVGASSRAYAAAFTIGTKGYVGTGGREFSRQKDFWEYDQPTNTWSQKAAFPGAARSGASAFSIKNRGYLGIGDTGVYTPAYAVDFWEYDPDLNTWKKIADFPGAPRALASAFSINNKGYVGLGEHRSVQASMVWLKDLWEYNPSTNSWTRKADFGGAGRFRAVGFAIGDRGYMGTGNTDSQFWEYNPLTDRWTRKADFPSVAPDGIGFSIGSKGYIHACNYPYFFQYNPQTDQWIHKPTFNGPRRWGATGFSIGGKGYMGMGHHFPEFFNDMWEYTPSNEPPIANGWLMKYYSPTSVLLNAWGSYDPEGGPVKFWWEKISGPSSFTMLYQNASTPVISNLVVGIYQFQLTVTDDQGASAKDTVTIAINSLTKINERNFNFLSEIPGLSLFTSFSIFPNPAFETLNYNWTDAYRGDAQLSLVDLSGKTLSRINIRKTGNKFNSGIPLTGIKPGLYYLLIRKEDGTYHIQQFFKK